MVLLNTLWRLFLVLINPILSVPAAILIAILIWKNRQYKRSAYFQITKRSYLSTALNVGFYGEYLIYKALRAWEHYGAKFLFNVYVPTADGRTSEIDVLMINARGIFVFESKNYSGWIFGNENQKNWYQTLPAGRGRSHKESFYNPIMQNRTHIKHLQAYLGEPMLAHSIIVFSDRCTLRNITFNNNGISVVNRYEVEDAVNSIFDQVMVDLLSDQQIIDIYNKLYPLTQVDELTKQQHIATIQHNLAPTFTPSTGQNISESPCCLEPKDTNATFNSSNSKDLNASNVHIEPADCAAPPAGPVPPQCPICGGTLIARTASRGVNAGNRFWGCSNYPKCKYIENIANKTT